MKCNNGFPEKSSIFQGGSKSFRTLTLAVIIALLLVVIPATPAFAAPIITLSPSSGSIGAKVTVTGINFDSYAGDNIFIFFNGAQIEGSPITVPGTGTFSIDFNIPDNAVPGTTHVTVKDKDGNQLGESKSFTIWKTKIKLDAEVGIVGTVVTIDGEGFYAGKKVTFYYYYNGSREMLDTKSATLRGECSYSFAIPESIAGEHTVLAQDTQGNSAEADFEVIPSISLKPTSGVAGDEVTVIGSGFGYKSDVKIYFDDKRVRTDETDKYGGFKATFDVPLKESRSYDVDAEDDEDNTARARFTITAEASLSRTSGYVGTEITISGTGFKASKSITITFDNVQIGTTATNVNGNFSGKFTVPSYVAGTYKVEASDGINTDSADFTILISASLSQTTGHVGTKQTMSGIGFKPSGTVTIKYDNAEIATAPTDSNGAFSVTFDIPASKYGNHTITVTDGTNTVISTFTMESTPPPVPVPLLPEDASKTKSQVHFKWEDVDDPSGVTYILQIASEANFTADSILLEKKALTAFGYTLSEEEKLPSTKKEVPYYWRVRAIDGASNESEWTIPGSFYVGFTFPGWALYTLIGLGVVLVGFLCFWLGRRTAFFRRF